MSYTFLVFPAQPRPFDPEAIGARATELLRAWLESLPLERMVELSNDLLVAARSRIADGASHVRVSLRESGDRAWTYEVEPGSGSGTIAQSSSGFRLSDAEQARLREAGVEERWQRASRADWCFEIGRMLGEPALSAVAHGFLAVAVAEQQEGLIHSVDGAWDASLLPCGPAAFAASFMRPERSAGERYRRDAEDKVRAMPGELGLFEPAFVRRVLEQIASRLVSDINRVRGNCQAELQMLDRALCCVETARVLTGGSPETERQLLIGSGSLLPEDRGGAIGRLCPTPEEYDRWLGRIGERLP